MKFPSLKNKIKNFLMLLSALSKSILMVDPTLSGAQIDFNRPQTVSYIL